MTDLYRRIYQKVETIPKGKVACYGQVAKAIGMHRGAHIVGWALKALPKESLVPWQRIINQKGVISIINPKFPKSLQKTLLEEEGISVIEKDGFFQVEDPPWFDLEM